MVDNGLGFNEKNFKAFEELDTLNKIDKGGKGIGRLSWLKVFDKINIDSVYNEDGIFRQKKFKFNCSLPDGINIKSDDEISQAELKTVVKLEKIKEPYIDNIPKKMTAIGDKIIEWIL